MAEQSTYWKSAADQVAGRKQHPTTRNRERIVVLIASAINAPANGDTAGSKVTIPAGSRLRAPSLSCNGGNASSTLSVGIKDAATGVAIDATALMNAASIASATTGVQLTGTKIINGVDYVTPVDVEVYATFGGATPLANQQIRVECPFIAS